VKQVMGLLMLAAAAYFIGSGLIGLVASKPHLAKLLHVWAIAFLSVGAGGWLAWRTFKITKSTSRRLIFTVVGVLVAAPMVWYAFDATERARLSRWVAFEQSVFETARREGKIVVMDFTAEWCINCKALKAQVLDASPVRDELDSEDVVRMVVDLTADDAPGWKKLESLGQKGIPLLAIYTPGVEKPWLSNAYTSKQVMAALEAARANKKK
jgi:thiol:disulfide interchange protein